MTQTTKDMKAELARLNKEAHRIEQETQSLRNKLDDSQYTETKGTDGSVHVEIVEDSDWNFSTRGRRGVVNDLIAHLELLKEEGDKMRIGPFTDRAARTMQSQLSKACDALHWPKRVNVPGDKLIPSFESHLKTTPQGVWLYVQRTYAPHEGEHESQ